MNHWDLQSVDCMVFVLAFAWRRRHRPRPISAQRLVPMAICGVCTSGVEWSGVASMVWHLILIYFTSQPIIIKVAIMFNLHSMQPYKLANRHAQDDLERRIDLARSSGNKQAVLFTTWKRDFGQVWNQWWLAVSEIDFWKSLYVNVGMLLSGNKVWTRKLYLGPEVWEVWWRFLIVRKAPNLERNPVSVLITNSAESEFAVWSSHICKLF
jgi:hypothetical protein